MLHVESDQTDGRTDGWKTKRWKRESSSSSFTFVFYCCFFRFWFVGNCPPDHHWRLDLFQRWCFLQLSRQTTLLDRFRNAHCFTWEFTFLFLTCSVCKHTRMLNSRVRRACTPAGKPPIYCTLPNEISEPVASPRVPASLRARVSARQTQTWEISCVLSAVLFHLNWLSERVVSILKVAKANASTQRRPASPSLSCPILSCIVLATEGTLEPTDRRRRTRCHRTHNLLHFSWWV